jgi:streptogramin lyase
MRRIVATLAALAMLGLVSVRAPQALAACMQDNIETADIAPQHIVTGPATESGGPFMYFTGTNADFIGKESLSGDELATFPTSGAHPHRMTIGPSGNDLWWTETASMSLGQMTFPAHVVSSHGDPQIVAGAAGITVAPLTGSLTHDPGLWFAEREGNVISEMQPSNPFGVTTHANPPASGPADLELEPQGQYVWYSGESGNKVAALAVDPSNPVQTKGPFGIGLKKPRGITAAPNGFLYFTEFCGDKVDRIDPITNAVATAQVLSPGSQPIDVIADAAALYVTESGTNKIARIPMGLMPNAPIQEWSLAPVLNHPNRPKGITFGPNGKVWFTEGGADKVGWIDPASGGMAEYPVCINAAQC